MTDFTIKRPDGVNPSVLCARITEQFGIEVSMKTEQLLDGTNVNFYVPDALAPEVESAIRQMIIEHDQAEKTTEQVTADVREDARVTLMTTDFRDLLARFDAAKDLAEVKAVLRETFVLMLKAAVAADVAVPDILTDLTAREG